MQQVLGLAAGLVGFIGYFPYIRDILKHRARPDKASWTIWAVQYTLLFFTQLVQHQTYALWLPGLQLLGVVLIFVLSLKYGYGQFNRQKLALLAGVGLALVLWYFTKNAIVALLISIAIEASGIALTSYKAYKDPSSETLTLWVLICVGATLGIVALGIGSPMVMYIYPLALAAMSFSVVASQLLGRRRQGSEALDEAVVK